MLNVVELFAGVGGFRVGLEKAGGYKVVWSNQWEPSTKAQHASWVYEERFGQKNHSNENIETVPTAKIPDHDLLVGGFPCQDYSVATTLKNSGGLRGKKGVLWWSIERILREKGDNAPNYLFLENVDRLLKSPASQRGRDFAIMLQSLNQLGYAVEWRVINAADYGMPQRRRRTFILAYKKGTQLYKSIGSKDWFVKNGVIEAAFESSLKSTIRKFNLEGSARELTESFNKDGKLSPFLSAGHMKTGEVFTADLSPIYDGPKVVLGDVLIDGPVPDDYWIDEDDFPKWKYLKGAKKEVRTTGTGYQYNYSEGGMIFPDPLDKPSRTIITGEGGKSPSRFKHVVRVGGGLRRLTPLELERLNMFPDNHTLHPKVTDAKRAFFMGNALVVGVVERIAIKLNDNV